jgi:hypothetical protein
MFRIVACLGLLFWANAIVPQDEDSGVAISYSDIQTHGVIGQLGLKLGTVTNVSGTIISGGELRTKAADGRYFLKISHVDQKQLNSPLILGFHIPPWVNVKLASDSNVGQKVELMAFEEGEFTGLPGGLDPMDQWSDSMFHFSTHLTILKDLDNNSTLPRTKNGSHSLLVVTGIIALMLAIGGFVALKRKSKIAT